MEEVMQSKMGKEIYFLLSLKQLMTMQLFYSPGHVVFYHVMVISHIYFFNKYMWILH